MGFAAPRANLYDDSRKLIITHFGGPTLQADDGSKVVGQLVHGVTVDPTAIPWLLLSTPSPAAGPEGDRLVHRTYIQRTATTGGLRPRRRDLQRDNGGHGGRDSLQGRLFLLEDRPLSDAMPTAPKAWATAHIANHDDRRDYTPASADLVPTR